MARKPVRWSLRDHTAAEEAGRFAKIERTFTNVERAVETAQRMANERGHNISLIAHFEPEDAD